MIEIPIGKKSSNPRWQCCVRQRRPMNWFGSKEEQPSAKRQFATSGEIKSIFAGYNESLYWMALVITADAELAKQSVVNASELASTAGCVFHDWLTQWAYAATARAAVQAFNEPILDAVPCYSDWICNHSSHDVLEESQINALRKLDPQEIARDLDPLARTVLVFHGCHHASISACAMLLRVPRKYVLRAYCRALQWELESIQDHSQAKTR